MDWIISQLQNLLSALTTIFNAPIFFLGTTAISLNIICRVLLFTIIIFIVSRRIGKWIGDIILKRMGMPRGSRDSASSVICYLLTAFGFLIVLQTQEIDVRSLAVVAGVVGLGFGIGLQNISSNFISGLTLLFERPIQAGDYVQIDDLLGTVEKVSIRSTIVRTLDGVFVIVPNSQFVDRQVVNWSYRDPKCRLHIPIGVSYDSDPVLVTEALLDVARFEKGVLSFPSPKVWFVSFGDSSLNFELLVWIDNPPDKEVIQSALNFRIEYELRKREITIPFPQRDVWIRHSDVPNFQNGGTGDRALENREETRLTNGRYAPPNYNDDSTLKPVKSLNNYALRELLRRIAYFEDCTDLELRKLIEYGYRQVFSSGQVVCQENDPGDSFYIILTGKVEVISQKIGQYIATLHQGEFFGEMSLLMGMPRTATVRTLEDSILFVVERHDLQKLLTEQPSLADQIAQKLAERQETLQDLGILAHSEGEETPFFWIRNRIKTLFEL
ncbi:MAG: mechanosensitive ion channel [Cyanobacteriota bacterium]|nr:mechanosensitive ion channel [Cyanobacteriota bacterium]